MKTNSYLRKILMALCAAGLTFASCTDKPHIEADYKIIPMPLEVGMINEDSFILKSGINIYYTPENESMSRNAAFLASYIKEQTGIELDVKSGKRKNDGILLSLGLENENPEAYHMNVTGQGVLIEASSEAGIFYGIQTLRKSVGVAKDMNVCLPAVDIVDQPRFAYRGMMLDVARHFFSVDEVKTYIDMLALHNINRFHWHLTEDQGWRIEIKKYPKLTEIGSMRKETMIGHTPGKYDGIPYGGFYTQEEAKEIVKYAAERYITVIPEIDLPGHMQAALASYPEFGCTGGPYEVWTQWGVSDNVLCAGNDNTIRFIKDVLAEIIEIFPSEYIHIGGDECPKVKWASCPKCQARIKEMGIKADKKHTKEQRLQTYVMHEAETFLNAHGRHIIGWDEILEGGLTPNATVMSWRGISGGIEAARLGHNAIMTPISHMYFNLYQSKDVDNEPDGYPGYIPIKSVYEYEPVPEGLSSDEKERIIGVQANLWTEYVKDFNLAEYMVLPRMAALCESQWSVSEKKDYSSFLKRIRAIMNLYDLNHWVYATHVCAEIPE